MVNIFDATPRFNPDPIVREEIRHLIEPFDPGDVFVSVVISTVHPIVRVTSSTFTDNVFVMDGRELYVVPENDLVAMSFFIGCKAGQYFCRLMNEPVPSNVALGEN